MSAPLEISLKEIKSITNNFDKANFIGEGFLGEIYKGRLSLSGELADVSVRGLDNSSRLQELVDVDVAVRRLDNSFRLQELAFEKEISILSRHKHKNMVSIVGFCYEDNEMLIINERVARGSLRRRLSDPELTWTRRLRISVGAVCALSYLHKFNIIHHNINTNTILVDEKWEAKISGFEYSITIPARDLDLAYEKLGIGIYKSDVFSIGVVLFELLCGEKAFTSEDNSGFQASIAMFNYENRTLNNLVDPDLFSQMDPLSFKIFSDTAYSCLNNQRSPPTMDEVLKRLERALKVQQMRDNNEHSAVPVERTIPDHLKLKVTHLFVLAIVLVCSCFCTRTTAINAL
ncbi:receptor-like protein kinase ANXUR2 [Bidens hawaiensis]|uniref:receptor-like protein kinase ANXUR2 n=1 Tax=Bidens hawaiensis TaxID=980011 RepID=UPI00404B340C